MSRSKHCRRIAVLVLAAALVPLAALEAAPRPRTFHPSGSAGWVWRLGGALWGVVEGLVEPLAAPADAARDEGDAGAKIDGNGASGAVAATGAGPLEKAGAKIDGNGE